MTSPLRLMTFNLRGSFVKTDGVIAWGHRADLNVRTLLGQAPDAIGFQEFEAGNLEVYEKHLTGYERQLGPDADNAPPHEHNAIYWSVDRFTRLDGAGFWLSETPDRYSGSWGTRCIRCANWVLLCDRATGHELVHLNTHLDHVSERARDKGARLIVERLGAMDECVPQVVTGDFNCAPGSTPYRRFAEAGFLDAFQESDSADSEESFTFHGFQGEAYPAKAGGRIDWILMRGTELRVVGCWIVRDAEPPIFPSDHYPVVAELQWSD